MTRPSISEGWEAANRYNWYLRPWFMASFHKPEERLM